MSLLSACRRRLVSLLVKIISVRWQSRFGPGAAYMPLDTSSHSTGVLGADATKSSGKWRPRRRRVLAALVVALIVLALVLGLALGLGLKQGDEERGPVIDLGYANYTGTYLPNGVSQYLGMRYARPPTGHLDGEHQRLQRLKRKTKERKMYGQAPCVHAPCKSYIIDIQQFGPICLGVFETADDLRDEDCLYANVWGPTNVTAEMKLPVIVFIQGGGYTRLSNYNWNASQLVETSNNNIVFVNFNYRVGLWGFLAGEEVRDNGDLNVGLLDQRFLLEWVQKHIHKFGGDPDHVVIHGISAGAGSVALQLAAFGGRNDNLYIGAIAESIFIPHHPPVNELEYQINRTMDAADCSDSADRMDCLRDKSSATLQSLNVAMPFPGRSTDPLFYWTPCVDGSFLQDLPSVLYEEGRFLHVPCLFGTCTNEGSIFPPSDSSTDEDLIIFFQDQHPNITSSQGSHLLSHYPREQLLPDHASWFPSAARALRRITFICPTNNILDSLSRNTTSLYAYRYNVHDSILDAKGLGVPHVTEAPAVFGPDMLTYTAPESYKTYNADVVPLVMNYFLSFARSLDPNIHKLEMAPEWKRWGQDRQRMVLQTGNSTMEQTVKGELERCEFWKDMGESLYK